MEDILNVQTPIAFDESISHYEVHAHQSYTASNFNNSDEIRISIQHQDLNLLPSKSSLHICGRLSLTDNKVAANTVLVNNAICHLFEEIRYEINAIEIDRCKNVGLTSLMKGWASLNSNQTFENAGWTYVSDDNSLVDDQGYFDLVIPLSMILGFAEDYRKIVVNSKHELILRRSNTDLNAVLQKNTSTADAAPAWDDFKITLSRIEWLMPYVILSDEYKIRLLTNLQKNRAISMSFRSWELFEYPVLPNASKHVWTVKTSNQLEKPRFVIVGFQTQRKNQRAVNASLFDHCNISNLKLFLNSQYYPYRNLNLNINQNQFALLYDMYANFQRIYYGKDNDPYLNKQEFINNIPLMVIDCSKQNESLKNAPVDVRLEFDAPNNFPANTAAYCLIIHDRIVEYNPMSGDVKIVV